MDGEESAGLGFPKLLQPARDGFQVWLGSRYSDGQSMKMMMIGWPGEERVGVKVVLSVPTQVARIH